MNRIIAAMLIALAGLAGVASSAPASHLPGAADPAGECDVNVAPGTYDITHYTNDPRAYDGRSGDNYAVVCFEASSSSYIHDDSDDRFYIGNTNCTGTTCATGEVGNIKLRPAANQTTVPVLKGQVYVDGRTVTVQHLKLDTTNTFGVRLRRCGPSDGICESPLNHNNPVCTNRTTSATGVNECTWIDTADPGVIVRSDFPTFQYVDVTNVRGICFNAATDADLESSFHISFSKVHNCGDPNRISSAGMTSDDCTIHPDDGGGMRDDGCRSDIHDHGLYANNGNSWTISDNWIYDNEARGISLHKHGDLWYATRNIIDANGDDGVHYSSDVDNTDITGNVITNSDDNNIGWYCPSPPSEFACTFDPDDPVTTDRDERNEAISNCLYENGPGRNIDNDTLPANLVVSPNDERPFTPYTGYAVGSYVVTDTACTTKDPLVAPGPEAHRPQ